jgi:hypothetical protein
LWEDYSVKPESVGKLIEERMFKLGDKQLKDLLSGTTIMMWVQRVKYQDEVLRA